MAAVISFMILLSVHDWSENQNGVRVKFGDGSVGTLPRSSRGYDLSVRTLASAGQAPVAVTWGGKEVLVSAIPARRDAVQAITELNDGSWRLVLTKMDGTPRVLPDHPAFSRIRSVVTRSVAEKREIWLAIQLPEFVVADARIADN